MRLRTIVFATVIAIAAPTLVQRAEAACSRSCSEVAQTCVQMGGKGCEADLANCMKTGNLHMPSGRTFTNLCRK